jgi:glyoxylase-like metal-dependent hydrolase (beta-lactamase superfamily II)
MIRRRSAGQGEWKMADQVNSLLSLFWRLPLEGARQMARLALAPLTSLAGGGSVVGATAAAVESGVDKLFRATEEAVGQLQDQTLDLLYDTATLQPFLQALQQNFTQLGPEPEIGSQKQPEIEFLKAVNDTAPAGNSNLILALAVLYTSVNRQAEGVRVFQGYLRNSAAMETWQRGVYLSALALLQASQAQVTPAWQIGTLLARAQAALETARLAKEVTSGEPDFSPDLAKVIARWVSGLVNAQLPPPLGNRQTAFADLEWVNATITRTTERAAQAFTFLRESYFQLARLFRDAGDERQAEKYLDLSTFSSFEDKTIILATLFSSDSDGLRNGIKHVTENGGGTVFTVSGQDMSEYNFVLTRDGRHLVAIDAGSREDLNESAYRALVEHLRQRGIEPPPLTDVISTHTHWDHVSGLPAFRRLNPRLRVYARANYEAEQAEAAFMPPPYDWFLGTRFQIEPLIQFRPDVVIEADGPLMREGITIGGTRFEFKLIAEGGGETPDGLFVYLPEQKVLFAGDFIVPWLGSPYNHEGNLDSLLHSISWIDELKPEVILHGHETVTLFYSHWETLHRLRPHLVWLRDEILRWIHEHRTRVEVQEMNLYPAGILQPEQQDVQIPFLLMRESVINRLFLQTTGYWGPRLENVDYLTPEELGSIFGRYLGLSPEEISTAVNRMIANGDLELAGRTADWALYGFPGSDVLQKIRRKAYLHLVQKWQVVNPFKFLMYAEHVEAPVHQLQPELSRGASLDLGFGLESLYGSYDLTSTVGAQRAAGIGEMSFDGAGRVKGWQRFNAGAGLVEQTLTGTYQVFKSGMGEGQLRISTAGGGDSMLVLELTPMQVESVRHVRRMTELVAVAYAQGGDSSTPSPLTRLTLVRSGGGRID